MKSKYVKNVYCNEEDEEEDEEEEEFFIGTLSCKSQTISKSEFKQQTNKYQQINEISQQDVPNTQKGWNVNVKINNKNVNCQVDTGADTNILSGQNTKDLCISNYSRQTPVFLLLVEKNFP